MENTELFEGRVDPNILLNIDFLVRDGKVTSNTQYFILAKMCEMLKYGEYWKDSNWFAVETPADIIAEVKALPVDQLVELAKQFRHLLFVKDQDILNKLAGQPEMSMLDWIGYVTKAQY